LNAIAPGQLLHVTDILSNRRFLVDTGAAFSIFPHISPDRPCGPALQGPGGQAIQCWGEKEMQLQLGSRRFGWTFLLAAVDFAILGADFLKHHKLAVDLHSDQLVDTEGMCALSGMTGCVSGLLAAVAATPPLYRFLFSDFPTVTDRVVFCLQ
jgi:hypothetical protein